MPILAYAWDKIIQLIYINEDGTSLELDGFYYSDKEVINMFFMGDSILLVLFESKDGREVKVLYTTKFYPGTYRHFELLESEQLIRQELERISSVTEHAQL